MFHKESKAFTVYAIRVKMTSRNILLDYIKMERSLLIRQILDALRHEIDRVEWTAKRYSHQN